MRWSDCDPAGVVYYPNYFTFVESALSAFLEVRGTSWPDLMRAHGLGFPRVDARCRYVRPAAAGDRLRVEIRVAERRSRGLRIAFAIDGADDRRIAEGEVAFVALRTASGMRAETAELPPAIVDLFSAISPASDR